MKTSFTTSDDQNPIVSVALFLTIVIGFAYMEHTHANQVAEEHFKRGQYSTHYVTRIGSDHNGVVVLLENGDTIKQLQFADDSAALIRLGDAVDVVYSSSSSVESARRHSEARQ
jgi:hypothetical protein